MAVIAPNVRGSTGYGKTFASLDDGKLREDSVKDIGALLDWIAGSNFLDASRVAILGSSYGGYIVLAGMIRFGSRVDCILPATADLKVRRGQAVRGGITVLAVIT